MIRLIVRVGVENLNRTNYRVFDVSCPALEKLIKEADDKLDELVTIGLEIADDPPPAPAPVVAAPALVPAAPIAGIIRDSQVAADKMADAVIIALPSSGPTPVVGSAEQQAELKRSLLERMGWRKANPQEPPKLPG